MGDVSEVEIRFGKFCNGRFVSDVGEAFFTKVLGRLRTNPKWSATETLQMTDERLRGGVRRRTAETGTITCCKKEKITLYDVKTEAFPLDYRLCLSAETPVTNSAPHEEGHVVQKVRHRFVHKDLWAFELTQCVHARAPDSDSESLYEHQIEIELLQKRPAKGSRYAAEYGILLASDILKMLV